MGITWFYQSPEAPNGSSPAGVLRPPCRFQQDLFLLDRRDYCDHLTENPHQPWVPGCFATFGCINLYEDVSTMKKKHLAESAMNDFEFFD